MTLSFKIDSDLRKALEHAAASENRSLSNYIVTVLIRHLETQGIEWRPKSEAPAGRTRPKK